MGNKVDKNMNSKDNKMDKNITNRISNKINTKYEKIYIAIDLKSFYAAVECQERGLNPLTTNLVVADKERTEKTVCLAVSPSLKQYGIGGRARLYEVIQKVKEINKKRKLKAKNHNFIGSSYDDLALKNNPNLELNYIVAPPRMSYYKKYSTNIYKIYLKWFSAEDIYVYSIDEVFIDITHYLKTYNLTPRELATKVIKNVFNETGITATCGIGTNLYLCKIAMDIVAKHVTPDENGVRIAGLDEKSYRKFLWDHKPLTDFWRIGKGIARKLEEHKIYTMGDIARTSINNEDLLYKLFGVNAELLIDHSWGYEPCTIESIKSYKPITNSISSGQVLQRPYNYEETKLIIKEMTELLTLDLVKKNLITSKLVLTIGYDVENIRNSNIKNAYTGEITLDRYGRKIPKHSHGTINIDHKTSSNRIITQKILELYDNIINKNLLVRRLNLTACDIVSDEYSNSNDSINSNNSSISSYSNDSNTISTSYGNNSITISPISKNWIQDYEQISLFVDYSKIEKQRENERSEKNLQKAILNIKSKYGKNAILKGMNFMAAGTTIERNKQIGGHRS